MFEENYRNFYDLDFISVVSQNIDISKFNKPNITEFKGNNMLAKFQINNIPVDLLNVKLIPKNLVKQLNSKISVPKFHWMLAMKFIQIFKLAQLYGKNKDNYEFKTKLNNSILDLTYLLSKKDYSFRKFYESLETLTISNAFVTLLTNEIQIYKFYSLEQQQNFNNLLHEFIANGENNEEVFIFLNLTNSKLLKNSKYEIINNCINKVLNNFNKSIERLTKNEIISQVYLNNFFIDINDKEMCKYISDLNKKNTIKGIKNLSLCFSELENKIDIRQLFLLELNKELNYAKR
ncbi:hypothetical protein WG617_00865 [Mycoplasmopsis felifaucium]|uniref:Uncharacterized protein n=2 Tax=Mycoplasmopsis felifaucium TaxID=35768 RepID=A0ABZ2RQ60_9BACT